MPGVPPTTPNYAIPRYGAGDAPNFPEAYNDGVDVIDAAVIADIEAQLDAAAAQYETIFQVYGHCRGQSTGALLYASVNSNQVQPHTSVSSGALIFYYDPADYVIPGRVQKLRVRTAITAGAGPGSIRAALHRVDNAIAPAPDPDPNFDATPIVGSEATIPAPGQPSKAFVVSADFDPPAAGWFSVLWLMGPAGSAFFVSLNAAVERRYV